MLTPSRMLVLALYVAAVAAAVWLLLDARARALRELDTPEARSQWDAFRAVERMRQEEQGGPVRRKVPRSDEPPTLVLMRDHFTAVLAACLVLGSCLFWLLVLLLRGAFRGGRSEPGAAPPDA